MGKPVAVTISDMRSVNRLNGLSRIMPAPRRGRGRKKGGRRGWVGGGALGHDRASGWRRQPAANNGGASIAPPPPAPFARASACPAPPAAPPGLPGPCSQQSELRRRPHRQLPGPCGCRGARSQRPWSGPTARSPTRRRARAASRRPLGRGRVGGRASGVGARAGEGEGESATCTQGGAAGRAPARLPEHRRSSTRGRGGGGRGHRIRRGPWERARERPHTSQVVRFVAAQRHPLALRQAGALRRVQPPGRRGRRGQRRLDRQAGSCSRFPPRARAHARSRTRLAARRRPLAGALAGGRACAGGAVLTAKSNATSPIPTGSRWHTASSASRRLPLLQWQ